MICDTYLFDFECIVQLHNLSVSIIISTDGRIEVHVFSLVFRKILSKRLRKFVSDMAFDAEPDQHHVDELSACMSDFRMDYSPFFWGKVGFNGQNNNKKWRFLNSTILW